MGFECVISSFERAFVTGPLRVKVWKVFLGLLIRNPVILEADGEMLDSIT